MARIEGRVDADGPMRLDRYIADVAGILTRSQLKARLEDARVNGKAAKLSREVKANDRYELSLRDEEDRADLAEDIDLSVLFENDSVIVVDKAQGMVTHPAHGNWSGTLANALLGRLTRAAGTDAPARAGIVHRLDKDTSGVIIAAKTAAAQEFLAAQFRARSTVKVYLAVVQGSPPADTGRLDTQLARDPRDRKRFAVSPEGTGKRALTEWRVLARSAGYTLLALRLYTGRTHQLRVHCRHIGCPILGDPVYGRKDARFPDATLMLHARELRIVLPGEADSRRFLAPVPDRFAEVLRRVGMDAVVDGAGSG
ncbi:MAG: RluA family pseudouridine synthase [Spirochaetales bacterium]|nr:RluA family pseudouridine synthase [Spirochaetales bacterium]